MRAIGLVLMPPAMAVVVALLVPGTSANVWVIVARFLLLGLGVTILCRGSRLGVDEPEPLFRHLPVLIGVGLAGAGLDALFPTSYTEPLRVAVMASAAGMEEVLFRVELPLAIAAAMHRSSLRTRVLAGYAAAQLSFAFTHLAVHGGLTTSEDVLEVVRLFGTGASAVVVYRLAGIWAASAVHAFLNYATVTSRLGMATYPEPSTVVLWTVLVSLLAMVAVAATTLGLHANKSGRAVRLARLWFGSPLPVPRTPAV